MLVANGGVAAVFAVSVLANQLPPPMPLLVTAALFSSPTPAPPAIVAPTPPPPPVNSVVAIPTPTGDALGILIEEAAPTQPDPAPAGDIVPEAAVVSGVVGHKQSRPLSCESRSAADWAAFFGAAIDELEFLGNLPASDDPDRGFVGDVNGAWGQTPPNAYGVHAGPVARLLTAYGVPAEAQRYIKWELVQREIAAGRPVIAWVAGHVEVGHTSQVYTAADGRQTVVAAFEHTVIVVGYTADTVTILDGAQQYTRSLATFLDAWAALRNMAIIYDGP
ncbi:MAG: C39 family peptidase [Anaerolineales bacterium]|nr:C39 family peptidase [Anaerolineales bacterium]